MPVCCTLVFVALLASVLSVRFGILIAPWIGGLDHPVGHKQHHQPVPYLGGLGVMSALALFVGLQWADGLMLGSTMAPSVLAALLSCGLLMFLTGLADDRWHLCHRLRLVVQAVAALIMIAGAGVLLTDLGELVPGLMVGLGLLSVPVTIFAVLSVSNALNMMDGLDGLSGALSGVSFLLLALVAYQGGDDANGLLALALAGGVLGFLVFNMRWFGRRTAAVYLGDNGSMLVGFMLAWLFIALSQGPDASMTPVTALYLFSLPLYDSALTIARRVWLGKSPFFPDRSHLHHLLLEAGASVETAVLMMVSLHFGIGLLGLAGLYLGVPEWLLFQVFVLISLSYAYIVLRPWRFVPTMRTIMVRLGITLQHGTGIFIGGIHPDDVEPLIAELQGLICSSAEIRVYSQTESNLPHDSAYLILSLGSWYEVRQSLPLIRKQLSMEHSYEVRQYIERHDRNDRRNAQRRAEQQRTGSDRRGQRPVREVLVLAAGNLVPSKHPSGWRQWKPEGSLARTWLS